MSSLDILNFHCLFDHVPLAVIRRAELLNLDDRRRLLLRVRLLLVLSTAGSNIVGRTRLGVIVRVALIVLHRLAVDRTLRRELLGDDFSRGCRWLTCGLVLGCSRLRGLLLFSFLLRFFSLDFGQLLGQLALASLFSCKRG